MQNKTIDTGVICVLLNHFNKYQLLRARELIQRLDRGEYLDNYDYEYIKNELRVAWEIEKLIKRNPEYQELYYKALGLLKEILDKALVNESNYRKTKKF